MKNCLSKLAGQCSEHCLTEGCTIKTLNSNTATIKLFQLLRNDGKPYAGKYNQNPRKHIDRFRKDLTKSKKTFTETNNNDLSVTFNYS
ncbi:hypothetical protein KAR91_31420 [Candidatus Pacearchaeota archaeon]|nr:hypothetical protein [Candidatus Pacearchaeota archaeon]